MSRRPLISPLFPYTTLFRSVRVGDGDPAGQCRAQLVESQAAAQGILELRLGERRILRQQQLLVACLAEDRKSTRLNSSHGYISYAVFCLKTKRHCTR